jgi:PAS domain S-box-containing protein
MLVVMFFSQELKHLVLPVMTLWESQIITNFLSALFGVGVVWIILNYRDKLTAKIRLEISDKEKSEMETRRTISILNATLDSTEDGILIVDRDGKVIKTNKKFLELWDIDPAVYNAKDDNILIKSVIDQLADPDKFLAKIKELYSHPQMESFDVLYFKDGKIFERYSKAQTIGSDIIGRVWSFRDVTARKRADEKIRLFEHTIASINEIVNIADFNDYLLYVNHAFCNAYGYTEEEIIGKHSSIFWSPQNPREITDQIIPETLKNGWVGELINKRKDGSEFPVSLSTSVVRDENNNPVAMVGIARDISEKKKEEKLNNVLYKISQAVQVTENLYELFVIIHENLKELLPVNNIYIALYDPQTDEISFPYFVDEVDSPPQQPKKPGKGCTEYVLRTGEAQLIYNDKHFHELNEKGEIELIGVPSAVWLGIPLKVLNNTIGVMVVQDYQDANTYGADEKGLLTYVSEQIASAIYKKRTEEQLISYTNELQAVNQLLSESEKRLKELNASKDKFFSIISHDLKGPYQGLLIMLDLLVNNYDNLSDEEKREIFLKMQRNSKRTYNLLDTLLQWARMQTKKIEFLPVYFNLWSVSSEVIDLLFESALRKKIKIINNIPERITIYADRNMIQLILRNLVSNAVKFSYNDTEIILSAVETNDNIEISVTDHGTGIPAENIENLFRLDVQTSTNGTAKETGTGLGLMLCRDMVNMHNGKIQVESEEGKGSTFRISLPKVGQLT